MQKVNSHAKIVKEKPPHFSYTFLMIMSEGKREELTKEKVDFPSVAIRNKER